MHVPLSLLEVQLCFCQFRCYYSDGAIVSARTLAMVDYVRVMTPKTSCECGKYGLLEHLLYLFFQILYK